MKKMNRKKMKLFLFVVLGLTSFCLSIQSKLIDSTSFASTTYYPTSEWRKTSPESLGLDSSRLDKMNQTIISLDIGIDSIHIIRYGYLAYKTYYEYYNYSDLHHIMSCTKSVSSILIGIAQTKGFITNLDERVLDIFPDRNFLNVDSRKESITIRHLLQMRSGLKWNSQDVSFFNGTIDKRDYELLTDQSDHYWDNWPNPDVDWNLMLKSPDWVQFVLDKPMVADPGTEFYYSSGDSHLLSAIIQKKTGINTQSFADQYLFGPLNITNYHWWNDSQGITMGAFGLWLRPIDMAKIGYLYLNYGNWNGEQIVPEAWVQKSTRDYSSGRGYGYQWWVSNNPSHYRAIGLAGQFITVVPKADIVIVMTSSEFHNQYPSAILNSHILKLIDYDYSFTDTYTSTTIMTSEIPSNTSVDESTDITTSLSSPQSTNFVNLTLFITFGVFIILWRKKKSL